MPVCDKEARTIIVIIDAVYDVDGGLGICVD